ncbi:MAG TPA: hypothetical protein VH092_33245 [Urbifossiella sp.]|nr:hypothetical protein [Urbifossiella sp.]
MAIHAVRLAPVILFAHLGGYATAADPPAPAYRFVPNTDRWVQVARGETILLGKLDAAGNLEETGRRRVGEPVMSGPARWYYPINFVGRPKKAYEYRSGVLVPGELHPDGNFVPTVGGAIMRFDDYRYSPGATPIWNLPGTFVPNQR